MLLLRFFLILASLLLLTSGGLQASKQFDQESRSRGLLFGWGHSWGPGWPGYGKTESDFAFTAFHPQMGWFVWEHLELYGEGSLLLYHRPDLEISAGLVGLGGRWHFWNNRRILPYVTLGGGLIWTSLENLPEIDRTFNFQVTWGAGIRLRRRGGPGIILEFRNHHISNAGTAGENLGVNAATFLIGLDWILR